MSVTNPNINDIVAPVSVEWGLEHNTYNFRSFSNVKQSVSVPGARWRGTMNFELSKEDERIDLEVFIEELEGTAGRFKVFNPIYKRYPELGVPNVNAAGQDGAVLTTQGWLPNRLVMRKGQFFNIGHELKRSKQDVYSDRTGFATLRFYPRIRVSPALNAKIITSAPYMLASLEDDYNPFSTDADMSTKIKVAFSEAIYDR